MPTYADLALNRFYLVIESEGEEIALVQPVMETNECYLLVSHDDYATKYWRKKNDDLFEITDELTEEQLAAYEELFTEEDEWQEEA